MTLEQELSLPDVCSAAAGGAAVWCAAGGRLLAFGDAGERLRDVAAPRGLTQLAAAGELLVAVVDARVAWLAADSGKVVAHRAAGEAPELVTGGGAVWAVDRAAATAWRVLEAGTLNAPRRVPGIERAAADGDRLWWTTREGTVLRDFDRSVDLEAGGLGAIGVCANSVWISVAAGLVRVGAWDAVAGPIVSAPTGPVPFLACADGALVGASRAGTIFVLDPRADSDARVLADGIGRIGHLVTARNAVWAFLSDRPAARVVQARPA